MDELNRNFVHVFLSANKDSCWVVNYSEKEEVNTFLSYFDLWKGSGHKVTCKDGVHSKFQFSCSKKFLEFLKTDEFIRAFQRMGVVVTSNYYRDIQPIE